MVMDKKRNNLRCRSLGSDFLPTKLNHGLFEVSLVEKVDNLSQWVLGLAKFLSIVTKI